MGKTHDVAIVGAGPAGSATAHYLARQGLDVILLDKFSFPRDKTCGDGLTPRALDVLADMGLLPQVLASGWRVGQFEIVAPRGHSTIAPMPDRNGGTGYAAVIPRLTLDHAILGHALASGAALRAPVRVADVERRARDVLLRGEQEGREVQVRARAAVIATGAATALLKRLDLLPRSPVSMLAARAYFEGLDAPEDRIQLRFDGVPLPGYGWIFPTSDRSANVGAGFLASARTRGGPAGTPRQAFDAFVRTEPMSALLRGARQAGPVKGHPLRVDFLSSPTWSDRILLVGEAAGLVNPLTGEGIDYALESAQIAARHLIQLFGAGDLSPAAFGGYDRLLRQRFERLFRFCGRVRDWFVPHPFLLNRLVSAANRHHDLRAALVNSVLGRDELAGRGRLRAGLKTALALIGD